MSSSDSVYICDLNECKMYLKSPILLPCGYIICHKHLEQIEEYHLNEIFTCPMCSEDHAKPKEGFTIIRKIEDAIKANLHLREKHKEVKNLFDKFTEQIEKHQSILLHNRGEYIYDYFSDLINKIDLHREQLFECINSKSNECILLLKQLEKYHQENNSQTFQFDVNYLIEDLSAKLANPRINTNDLIRIRQEISTRMSSISKSIYDLTTNINVNLILYDDSRFCEIVLNDTININNKNQSKSHSVFPCKKCNISGAYICKNCNIKLKFNCFECGIFGQTFNILTANDMQKLPSNIKSMYEKECGSCRNLIELNCNKCQSRVEFSCLFKCNEKITSFNSVYNFPDFD